MRFLLSLLAALSLGTTVLGTMVLGAAVLDATVQQDPLDLPSRLQLDAVAYAEAHAAQPSGSLLIKPLKPPTLPHLRAGEVRFEPSHLSKVNCAGPFFVAFRILVDGRLAGSARVDLEGRWTGRLLRAKKALPRKSIPDASQIETFDFEGTPPPGAITEFPEGSRLRLPVATGHILTQSDIQPIPMVNPGDPVRLDVVCGPLTLTSETLARSGGALGEKIRLELPGSRKGIQAVVTGPGKARLEWAPPEG